MKLICLSRRDILKMNSTEIWDCIRYFGTDQTVSTSNVAVFQFNHENFPQVVEDMFCSPDVKQFFRIAEPTLKVLLTSMRDHFSALNLAYLPEIHLIDKAHFSINLINNKTKTISSQSFPLNKIALIYLEDVERVLRQKQGNMWSYRFLAPILLAVTGYVGYRLIKSDAG